MSATSIQLARAGLIRPLRDAAYGYFNAKLREAALMQPVCTALRKATDCYLGAGGGDRERSIGVLIGLGSFLDVAAHRQRDTPFSASEPLRAVFDEREVYLCADVVEYARYVLECEQADRLADMGERTTEFVARFTALRDEIKAARSAA